MKEIDPGHHYRLLVLDGTAPQYLRFVKRTGAEYPGNFGFYQGTNLQSVLRACRARTMYLQGQQWCIENVFVVMFVSLCLWLLEFRAGRRHGRWYWHSTRFAGTAPMCPTCGHTDCEHDRGGE